ncbi:MAG: ABC transporter ATP-binding protein, partial [Pseudomonadota bacterium]
PERAERFGLDADVTDKGRAVPHGSRPEFVGLGDATTGVPATVTSVADLGRRRVVRARAGDQVIHAVLPEGTPVPEGPVHLAFDHRRTRVYADGWLAEAGT